MSCISCGAASGLEQGDAYCAGPSEAAAWLCPAGLGNVPGPTWPVVVGKPVWKALSGPDAVPEMPFLQAWPVGRASQRSLPRLRLGVSSRPGSGGWDGGVSEERRV